MPTIGLTRAGLVYPIARFLERIGGSAERHLARSGLPPRILDDQETLIPTTSIARLLSQASRAEGIETFGLLCGHETTIDRVGMFGRLVCRAPTLGDALQALVRYHPVFSSNGRMWLDLHDDRVELCQAFQNRFDREWQQASHYILMLMIGVIRLAAGATWCPAEVALQTDESPALRDFKPFLGTRLTFGQPATSVVFPRALLGSAMRGPSIPSDSDGIDGWIATAPGGDFLEAIVRIVKMLSSNRYPRIQETAKVVDMSVRTLQRHLTAAGCTHEDLVGRIRFVTAATLLEESDAKILDIALDLGYSDHAHFTRAFHRWAGCSPQEYRRRCVTRRS